MAEKHAHHVRPAVDSFMVLIRISFANNTIEKRAVVETQNLGKYVYIYYSEAMCSEIRHSTKRQNFIGHYNETLVKQLMEYKFVDSEKELAQSVIEFFDKPEFWKATIGNAPKYFVHIQNGNIHIFGLSKFCAIQNITVEEYLSNYRYKTDGGKTQKHITKLTKKDWVPWEEIDDEIQNAFNKWIIEFYPNYPMTKASIITISKLKIVVSLNKKFIDPKTLEEKLKLQREIGDVGELIALEYELNRLTKNGVKNAKRYIEHTAKINAGAGFDLSCLVSNDYRFIEVKSSLNINQDFFITENEYQTLEKLGDNAFIYFVQISDITKKEGQVLETLRNPIQYLKLNGSLKPISYKATLRKKNVL